ncbi:ATP-dependent Clp protease proteolytic subunit [Frankliniella fusca]|uniref:ATP-dependent Clp protease proteolytic subunit n=1 Tax=Frankliniella fusca TaxID=407009 RepID=A0AAE1I088_9NEOP|nr:ATP-dependent Clp protease proteolytic subunit [Frankliniella fusca]
MSMSATWFCFLLLAALLLCEGAPSADVSSWFSSIGNSATQGMENATSWLKTVTVNATRAVGTEALDAGVKLKDVNWICVGQAIVCGVGALLFVVLGLHWLLLCLGFGALGPIAGSIAALCQPAAGVSFMFSCMQSVGMTFLACWQGQMVYTMTAWFIMIPLLLLGAGGAGYAGYVYLPACQNCLINGTVCDTLNDTIVVQNVTNLT